MMSSSTTTSTSAPNNTAAKAEEIRRVLSEPTVDLWKLRELALTEGGLVNDSLRKLAWPKLVGVHPYGYNNDAAAVINNDNKNHSSSSVITDSLDHEQIERDVSRVTWHLLTGNQRSRNFQMKNKHRKRIAQLLKKKQRRLGDYLNLVLVLSYYQQDQDDDEDDGISYVGGSGGEGDTVIGSIGGEESNHHFHSQGDEEEEKNRLRYYQGFHDVGSIVLSALGGASASSSLLPSTLLPAIPVSSDNNNNKYAQQSDNIMTTASSMGLTLASQVLLRLSRSHLRDAMRSNFQQLQSALKLIVMPLTAAFDPQLHSHLADCEMEPYFCLSWVITWFSHDVRDTALVKRLYDFFIVSHPLMSVYMSVAMMIHPLNRIEVLGADCDFACVHNALADLPKNSSNVGWKYLPGDHGSSGYATGSDQDDDASYDPSLQDQSIDDGDDGSVLSSYLGQRTRARVPFQELIDLSISLMHKIPPRNLINLAQRYHTEITLQPLMAQSSSIALLQPPPAWGLATHTDSDWVLRQKIREESGLTKLNRHQRKVRLKQQMGGSGDFEYAGSSASTSTHPLLEKPSIQAIIASGVGPDGRADARKMRKKRRMIGRSVAVVVISMLVALAKNYFFGQSSSSSSTLLTKDVLKEDNVAKLLLSDESVHDAAPAVVVDVTDAEVVTAEDEQKIVSVDEVTVDLQQEVKELLVKEDQTMLEESESKLSPAVLLEDGEGKRVNQRNDNIYHDVCDDDESLTNEKHVLPTILPTTEEQQSTSPSSSAREATLQILMRSSVLFVKNLTTIQNNQTLDLHLDQLEQHFDFLMTQFMETAKATWFKVAPVLINALQIGWRQVKAGWLKISPVVKRELKSELDGRSEDWAEDAMKTWKKQEVLLRNQGKLIHSVVSNVKKLANKAGKERV
ncbi:hypothetical protein ACHAXR_010136 [Thalassiosira sp. AJA248-18]